MSWLLARTELTAEQLRAVELPPNEHRLILGGPGSGKTQVLLHRGAFLRDRGQVQSDRYHVFVFTNTLKDYIRSALTLLDLPDRCVSTLDSWCIEYHRRHLGPVPQQASGHGRFGRNRAQPDYQAVRHAVTQAVLRNRPPFSFEFVLVDEGQDLDEEVFSLLCGISKHVTVCMDRKQQIYDRGANESAVLRQLGLRKRNLALLDALRCSPYVTELAAALVEDPEEGRDLQRQTKTVQMEKETPLLFYAKDFEDERRKLLEVILVRQRRGDRIAILLPQKRQVKGFAKGLADAGLVVEDQDKLDFGSDAPKLLTYHSAKGLTFDTVLMPRLVPGSFPTMDRSRIERLMFVGVSRAVKWVYFSTDENQRFAPLEKIERLAASGKVTVQGARRQRRLVSLVDDPAAPQASTTAPLTTPPTAETEDEDDVLDIL